MTAVAVPAAVGGRLASRVPPTLAAVAFVVVNLVAHLVYPVGEARPCERAEAFS